MNKKRKNKIYYLWSASIVVCVMLAVFSLVFASCSGGDGAPSGGQSDGASQGTGDLPGGSGDEPGSELSPPEGNEGGGTGEGSGAGEGGETPGQETEPPADAVELGETEDAGQAYIDSITFLGDSTTYGLKAYGVLSGREDTTQVWTPTSGTLTLSNQSFATIVYPETGEEITIAEAVRRAKPTLLVITLGVNGVSFMDEEYFKSEYAKLIESVRKESPDTKIICNSIYPVASYYEHLQSINRENITAANGWIRSVAEATGTRYLDSASVLKDADGWLPDSYCNGDGIHLNSSGFLAVLEYMRTHALY